MLLLEKGDIDIARNLEADQLESLRDSADINVKEVPKGAIYYLGLNQKNEYLAKPEVREALKWLVDYEGIANSIVKGSAVVHQAFLPEGFLGAIDDQPYTLNVAKAKELLEQAGLEDGFTVTMDTRNASPLPEIAQVLQANWAEAGITLEILPGDNKQTLTKYRARTHDIYIGRWGPDYQDPHTNADTFASNPDNADGAAYAGKLAWRNAWDIPEMTARTAAAVLERDPARRAQMYEELQREHQETSPFVIMFQDIEVIAERDNVAGMIWGPSFDDNKYWKGHKGSRGGRSIQLQRHGCRQRRDERARRSVPAHGNTPLKRGPASVDAARRRRGRQATAMRHRSAEGCHDPAAAAVRVQLALTLPHLSRPAAGHLPDRPGRADRSGAGRGRRSRAARRLRAGADRARPASAALAAVPDLCRRRRAGRLRQLGADRQPGARATSRGCSRRRSSSPRSRPCSA